MKDVLACTCLL